MLKTPKSTPPGTPKDSPHTSLNLDPEKQKKLSDNIFKFEKLTQKLSAKNLQTVADSSKNICEILENSNCLQEIFPEIKKSSRSKNFARIKILSELQGINVPIPKDDAPSFLLLLQEFHCQIREVMEHESYNNVIWRIFFLFLNNPFLIENFKLSAEKILVDVNKAKEWLYDELKSRASSINSRPDAESWQKIITLFDFQKKYEQQDWDKIFHALSLTQDYSIIYFSDSTLGRNGNLGGFIRYIVNVFSLCTNTLVIKSSEALFIEHLIQHNRLASQITTEGLLKDALQLEINSSKDTIKKLAEKIMNLNGITDDNRWLFILKQHFDNPQIQRLITDIVLIFQDIKSTSIKKEKIIFQCKLEQKKLDILLFDKLLTLTSLLENNENTDHIKKEIKILEEKISTLHALSQSHETKSDENIGRIEKTLFTVSQNKMHHDITRLLQENGLSEVDVIFANNITTLLTNVFFLLGECKRLYGLDFYVISKTTFNTKDFTDNAYFYVEISKTLYFGNKKILLKDPEKFDKDRKSIMNKAEHRRLTPDEIQRLITENLLPTSGITSIIVSAFSVFKAIDSPKKSIAKKLGQSSIPDISINLNLTEDLLDTSFSRAFWEFCLTLTSCYQSALLLQNKNNPVVSEFISVLYRALQSGEFALIKKQIPKCRKEHLHSAVNEYVQDLNMKNIIEGGGTDVPIFKSFDF